MSELVSVVIPTRGRPERVTQALATVLAQSYARLEVVVVVDGRDDATIAALEAVDDPRLRVVVLDEPRGGAGARNAGTAASRGRWVAFLDDDDAWLPTKVERQIALALRVADPRPIIACQIIARSPGGDLVWPLRAPEPGEPVGDFLFRRRGLFYGEGTVQTGMLLAPRELLVEIPFAEGLRRFQETDWVLRAAARPGVGLHFVMEPLAVWHYGEERGSITGGADWEGALAWARSVRPLLSPAAYTDFLLTTVAHQARRGRAWRAFPGLLREAFGASVPPARMLALYLGMWLIPQPVRRRLRAALQHPRGGA